MDALKMAAVDFDRAVGVADDSLVLEADEIALSPRMKAGLAALLEALEYSRDLRTSAWDFGVEISSLRRLRLTDHDLRLLVSRGLVEHAIEVTPLRDAKRSFRRCESPVFGKKSCFVLAPAGAALMNELLAESDADDADDDLADEARAVLHDGPPARPRAPKWDRDRQELRVGSIVVKRFTTPAASQEAVLAAFEEQHWPEHIDDPLPACDEPLRKSRLQETINALNRTRRRPLVRFLGDRSGQGVHWEFSD